MRDSNGNGVVTGLTEISDVVGSKIVDGKKVPTDGNLNMKRYNVSERIRGSRERYYEIDEKT